MKAWNVVLSMSWACFGCASSQGTNPKDMSAAQHETAAGQEQSAATEPARQNDQRGPLTCVGAGVGDVACWSSVVNPTEQHREDAQEHHKLAEKHRVAASALREAEARDCAGVAQQDRDTSPFYHREDITEVSKVDRAGERSRPAGVRVVFHAVPGLTVEWMQRLVNCHRARAASVGYALPEMDYCPLALKGVDAVVSSAGDGIAVEVTSNDSDTVREIQRRAASQQGGSGKR